MVRRSLGLIYNQFGIIFIIQVLQRSLIPQTSNWPGTFFCCFLQQTSSRWFFTRIVIRNFLTFSFLFVWMKCINRVFFENYKLDFPIIVSFCCSVIFFPEIVLVRPIHSPSLLRIPHHPCKLAIHRQFQHLPEILKIENKIFFNSRFLRERGMASTPKIEYQIFLCIF